MENQLLLALQNNKLLKNVDISKINLKNIRGKLITINEGEILYRDGNTADSIFLIVSGQMNLVRKKLLGKTRSLILSENEYIGSDEFFDETARTSTAVALKDSYLIELSDFEVNQLIEQDPSVYENLRESIHGSQVPLSSTSSAHKPIIEKVAPVSESEFAESSAPEIDSTDNKNFDDEIKPGEEIFIPLNDKPETNAEDKITKDEIDIDTYKALQSMENSGNFRTDNDRTEDNPLYNFGEDDSAFFAGLNEIEEKPAEEVSPAPFGKVEPKQADDDSDPLKGFKPESDLENDLYKGFKDTPFIKNENEPVAENDADPFRGLEMDSVAEDDADPFRGLEMDPVVEDDADPFRGLEMDPVSEDDKTPFKDLMKNSAAEDNADPFQSFEEDPKSESNIDPFENLEEIPGTENNKDPFKGFEMNFASDKTDDSLEGLNFNSASEETDRFNNSENRIVEDFDSASKVKQETESLIDKDTIVPEEIKAPLIPSAAREKKFNKLEDEVMTAEQLELINKAAELVNSNIQIDDVLKNIVDVATNLTKADRGTLYLADKETNELWSKVAMGNEMKEIRLKIGEGISGWVAESGEVVNIEDVKADQRFKSDFDKSSGYTTKNMLCFPIKNKKEEVVGVLQLLNSANGKFSDLDQEFLNALSIHAALALENAGLVEKLLHGERVSSLGKMANFLIQDIKKPILVSKRYAEHLKTKELPPEIAQVLDMMLEQLNQVADLVQTTSSYSEGKRILHTLTVNFMATMEDFSQRMASYVQTRSCEIINNVDANINIKLDVKEFYQCYMHIVRNACDAMPDGGRIVVFSSIEDKNLVLSFKDNGLGIPDSIKDKIFEPFTSHGKKEGTGLGLSITKQIVEAHGGTIDVESNLGEGATIIITLPL